MPDTLATILIRYNLTLLLCWRSIGMFESSLRSGLRCRARRRSLSWGFPLRGSGGKLDEVVFARYTVPLRYPSFWERGRAIRRPFLPWPEVRLLAVELGHALEGISRCWTCHYLRPSAQKRVLLLLVY